MRRLIFSMVAGGMLLSLGATMPAAKTLGSETLNNDAVVQRVVWRRGLRGPGYYRRGYYRGYYRPWGGYYRPYYYGYGGPAYYGYRYLPWYGPGGYYWY